MRAHNKQRVASMRSGEGSGGEGVNGRQEASTRLLTQSPPLPYSSSFSVESTQQPLSHYQRNKTNSLTKKAYIYTFFPTCLDIIRYAIRVVNIRLPGNSVHWSLSPVEASRSLFIWEMLKNPLKLSESLYI